jgi:hypothetical protein
VNPAAALSGAGAWNPSHYPLMYQMPPDDAGTFATADTSINLQLPAGEYFVTVMSFDAYGQSVGRQLYAVSEEIRVAPAPLLEPIGDLEVSHTLAGLDVPLALNADDPAALQLSARIEYADPTAQRAYDLDRQFAFTADRSYYQNIFRRQERWLRSNNGWHYIRPDGNLYKWTGHEPDNLAAFTAEFVAHLGTKFYNNPRLLSEAAAPPPLVADLGTVAHVSVNAGPGGPTLTVEPADGFLGTFRVHVTADDGQRQVTDTFDVSVVNHGAAALHSRSATASLNPIHPRPAAQAMYSAGARR